MVNLRVFKSINPFLLTALAALVAFLMLFAFRSADDNRLFSWQWVFAQKNVSSFFLLLIVGMIAAYPLARSSIFGRRPVIFLFLCSFVAAALLWTEPELILDASRYFTQAKHLEVYGTGYFIRAWGGDIPAWTDLPAVPFLYGQIFRFLGENRLFIQAFTTFLFSGTIVLAFLIGKTLWDEETGFFAGLLLLSMPFLLAQVPLMLVDVPTMFFLTLSIFTFMKALEQGRGLMITLSSFSLFFTVFSKYSAWIMISVLGIILLVYWRKDPKTVFLRSLAVILPAFFLIGAVAILKFDVISEQIRLLISYQKPGLGRWQEKFLSTFFFQVHPFITLAAGYSLIVAFKKRDWKYAIISWLIVLIPVLDIKRSRYILPAFPLLALMAAYGLQNFERRDVRRFIVIAITVSSLIMAFAAYLPFARQTSANNLKAAGEYLNASGIETIEVLTLPLKDPVVNPSVSVPLLDLFTKKRVLYQYHPEFFPPPEDVETRSLRYTWEYKNPEYYAGKPAENDDTALVIISGETDHVIPPYLKQRLEHYRLSKRFAFSADPFRLKTIVEIYTKE